MWRAENSREATSVVCIACGRSISRSDAREYDKEGNRWERDDKQFEHLCKDCHGDLSHQPRAGLESLLIEAEEGAANRREFLRRYASTVDRRSETTED